MGQIKIEKPDFKYQPFILYACDENLRYRSSAGGVVSQLIKFMFEKGYVSSALTFEFSPESFYIPKIAYSYEDYRITGSIYHEIDIVSFIKKNINSFTDRFVVTALPCQVKAIKEIARRNKKDVFVISLTCSAQQTKEATYYLLDYLGIERKYVEFLRYRGNGWPSGIYIKTKDGKEYRVDNSYSIWMYIFHSLIFSLDRCISCKDTFGMNSDIVVADPWLERYVKNEKKGATITIANTEKGYLLLENAIKDKYLCIKEKITKEEVVKSQRYTLEKKYVQRKYKKFYKKMKNLFQTPFYKNVIFKRFPKIHVRVLAFLTHKILFKIAGEK